MVGDGVAHLIVLRRVQEVSAQLVLLRKARGAERRERAINQMWVGGCQLPIVIKYWAGPKLRYIL